MLVGNVQNIQPRDLPVLLVVRQDDISQADNDIASGANKTHHS